MDQKSKGSVRMPFVSKVLAVLIVCILFLSPANLFADTLKLIPASDTFTVEKYMFEGVKRADEDLLRNGLSPLPANLTGSEMSALVRSLTQLGYFRAVSGEYLSNEQAILFRVVERPMIGRVLIKGNDNISQEDLAQVLRFRDQRFFNEASVNLIIEEALKLYRRRGYYRADIRYSLSFDEDDIVSINFEVDEGPRFAIRQIDIQGLDQNVTKSEILDVLETSKYRWWSSWLTGSGRLDEDVLSVDRQRIQQFLLDKGYVESSVSDGLVEVIDEDSLKVVFATRLGPQYSIGEISLSGDYDESNEKDLLEAIESQSGEIFNSTEVRDDAFRVSDVLGDGGFAFANVIPETRVKSSEQLVDLQFRVEPGKKVTVREIRIAGNEKTYDKVIRRELVISEQDEFSRAEVKRSEALLRRLGFFEEVSIGTAPTDDPEQVDLDIKVAEASTGQFSVGAGYSSADGFLFVSRLSENNIFGTGRRAVFNFDIGDERRNFVVSLLERRLFDTQWSAQADLLKTTRIFDDFDRDSQGGALTVGYPLEKVFGEWAQDIRASLKYEYLNIDISNVDQDNAAFLVRESEGRTSASGITPRLVRNTIDNPLNPTRGSRQSIEVELTGLGGSEEFWVAEASNQWYYPLLESESGNLVFSWRTDFAYGETYDGDRFPLYRRYFPGGINSVRGYEVRTLGPRDEDGNEFGGSKQFVNNFEFIFPLYESLGLRGVVFYDVGEAFDDDESIRFSELRQAFGYGIRWASPLGPIRIEFGFPIDRESGEKSNVTQFSFGAPF